MERRVLLTCQGVESIFHDGFDDDDLLTNDSDGWTVAAFGGIGSESESAFRFDGRQTSDWNLFEISSRDTFDVWNGEAKTFDFHSGNAIVTSDNVAFDGADLQTQFGVVSAREPRSGSGGGPDHNEANLFQNTAGGIFVPLQYHRQSSERDLHVNGAIRFTNHWKHPWAEADSETGVFTPVTFQLDPYDGQEELITSITVGTTGWTVEFNHDVQFELLSANVAVSSNAVHGDWSESTLHDASITDEFADGAYPFAMGQNMAAGRGAADLMSVAVCDGTLLPLGDEAEPNNSPHEPHDLGSGDQSVEDLSIHQAGDEDWFRWTASEDGLLSASLYADADQGDIDLELYNSAGDLIDVSATYNNHEGIQKQVRAGDSYLFRVTGFEDSRQPSYKIVTSSGPLTGESIYVAVGQQVSVFDSNGQQVNTFRDPLMESGSIADVEIGPEGSIYVSVDVGDDAGEDGKIVQFSPNGNRQGVYSLPADPMTRSARYPFGFDVLEDGTFLVAQPNSGRIVRVNRRGGILETFPVLSTRPSDVTVKSTGELVIADDRQGESMLNPIPGGGFWIAERGSDKTTLRDVNGTVVTSHSSVRPIDAEENQDGTLYISELTHVDPFTAGTLRAIDAQGNTKFAVPIQGLPLGLAVSNGYKPAARPTPNVDSDADGLPDNWETNGLDVNLDGTIDLNLPALGASPRHKDLFVEIDAMSGRTPSTAAIGRVQSAFAAVPNALVRNPDARDGIKLHVLLDETNIALNDFTLPDANPTWQQVKANAWTEFDVVKARRFGTPTERASANWTNIRQARQQVFRYGLFADNYTKTESSGLAELPGNDFMVTLGHWRTPGGTEDQQAATLMHELGHTLGLKHGGSDDINYKPNYHSVMNYHWQLPGTLGNVGWSLDYSREVAATLNENNLDESRGLGFAGGSLHDTQNHTVYIGGSGHLKHEVVSEVGSIDFSQSDVNGDGSPANDRAVARDLNGGFDQNRDGHVSKWEHTPGETLTGHDDWSNLVFDMTNHHSFSDGIHQHPPMIELSELQLVDDRIKLDIPPLFVGSFAEIPVRISPNSGLTMRDLEFVISDGIAGGEISRSHDVHYDPTSPSVMLLAGHELGRHELLVREKATGIAIASFDYTITDVRSNAVEGPSLWASGQFSSPPAGQTSATSPTRPQNQGLHGKKGTWDVAVVLLDTPDQRFAANQVPAIRQLWAAETTDGVIVDGKRASLAHYFRELSQNQLDVSANVYGPVSLSEPFRDYFKRLPDGRQQAKDEFYVACAKAADHLIDYSQTDSVVCVSQSVNFLGGTVYSWPYHHKRTLKTDDCKDGKCDFNIEFVAMPADWNLLQRGSLRRAVNAGGNNTSGLITWSQDTATSPSSFQNGQAAVSDVFSTAANIDMTHPSIPLGTPMSVFQTERWDSSLGDDMRWDFPVQAGWYDVSLYFSEIFGPAQKPGARKFDVSIEGKLVLDDYDVFADVGANKGVVKTFTVRSDSNLDLDFGHVVQSPAIKGVEIRTAGRHIRSTLAHEIGHTLGMGDIYAWSGHTPHVRSRAPGRWDLMANENGLPHTLLPHRMRLGWVPDRDLKLIHLPSATSAIDQTVTLHPVERQNTPAGQYSGIEIRLADGWNYYCEYRVSQSNQIGDQQLPMNDRVVCTDVIFDANYRDANRRKEIMLLRNDEDGDGAVLGNGQDYREVQPGNNNELRISVSGADGNKANVRVQYQSANGLPPAPSGPDPSIRPWSTSTWQSPDIEVINKKNQVDPKFKNVPWENHLNTVLARIKNSGNVDAPKVRVEFWVRDYTLGGNPEFYIGEDIQDVAAGQTLEFKTQWRPLKQGHYCIIAKIVPYQTPGASPQNEVTAQNNMAQSNYTQFISQTASPASREGLYVQVGNPYDEPTQAYIHIAKQTNPLYRTYLEHSWFDLGPGEVRDVRVQVEYAYDQPPTAPFLESFIGLPNDVLLYATIRPPGSDAEAPPVPLGGARIRVLTGRATRIDGFQAGDDDLVAGRVATVDNGDAVADGVVLIAVQPADGSDTTYITATPDANGFFQTNLGVSWQSAVAYYVPADGFGESDSGIPIVNPNVELQPGNFNGDLIVDDRDIDALFAAIAAVRTDPIYDLNQDQQVDRDDVDYLIETILETQVGDVDLNGAFDSSDLVSIFQNGEYEDGIRGNSTWSSGDWNGDGEFDTSDLVVAFQKGGYS